MKGKSCFLETDEHITGDHFLYRWKGIIIRPFRTTKYVAVLEGKVAGLTALCGEKGKFYVEREGCDLSWVLDLPSI